MIKIVVTVLSMALGQSEIKVASTNTSGTISGTSIEELKLAPTMNSTQSCILDKDCDK